MKIKLQLFFTTICLISRFLYRNNKCIYLTLAQSHENHEICLISPQGNCIKHPGLFLFLNAYKTEAL